MRGSLPKRPREEVEEEKEEEKTKSVVNRSVSVDAVAYEESNVHSVYNSIASHFSSTRYQGWPRVCAFLESLPPHTTIADVGCGNGKYFASALAVKGGAAAHRYVLGMDYCDPLLRCAQKQAATTDSRTDLVRCDGCHCPLRPGLFDAAISIAVVHHYSTAARRVEAVRELLRLVRPDGGRVLLYVWAMEAREGKSVAKWKVNEETGDALVSWSSGGQTLQRYYHLFRQEELENLCLEAAKVGGTTCSITESYYDKENWCVVLQRSA